MTVSFTSLAEAYDFVEAAIKDQQTAIDYDALIEAFEPFAGGEDFRQYETPILLGCFLKKEPKKTYALLNKYREFCEHASSPEQYEAFKARCDAIVAPRMITSHGYRVPIGTENTEVLTSGILKVVEMMKGIGYDIFINSGTLLGVVRAGAFIPYDDDVDFGVILKTPDPEGAAREWIELKETLERMGLLRNVGWLGGIIKTNNIGAFSVDFFPAWIEGDAVFIYPHTFGNLERADLLPLKTSGALGLPVPQNPEKMLVSNYGENWRVPDPLFKFHWGRNKKKFDTFLNISKAIQP